MAEAGIVFDERIYGGSPEVLLAILKTAPRSAARMMLVGHNPDLEGLVLMLSDHDPGIPPGGKLLPTATAALLDIADLSTLAPASARLISNTRPAEIGECE